MANFVTALRITFSAALMLCPAFSPQFYAFYIAAGISDMLDGAIARRTNTETAFGAKLDTAADLIFVAVSLWKLLPELSVPVWLMLWIAGIALVKAVNFASGYVLYKSFVAPHTLMNKVTGALLFALPLTLPVAGFKYSAPPVCVAATFAAIQEGLLIKAGYGSNG